MCPQPPAPSHPVPAPRGAAPRQIRCHPPRGFLSPRGRCAVSRKPRGDAGCCAVPAVGAAAPSPRCHGQDAVPGRALGCAAPAPPNPGAASSRSPTFTCFSRGRAWNPPGGELCSAIADTTSYLKPKHGKHAAAAFASACLGAALLPAPPRLPSRRGAEGAGRSSWPVVSPLTLEMRVPAAVRVSRVLSSGYLLMTWRRTRRVSPRHSWASGRCGSVGSAREGAEPLPRAPVPALCPCPVSLPRASVGLGQPDL